MASVPTGIRSWHLPNTSPNIYKLSQLALYYCLLLIHYYYYLINFMLSSGVQKYSQIIDTQLKILGTRYVTWRKSHSEDPQVSGVVVQNSVAVATWRPGFVAVSYHSHHNHQDIVFELLVMFTKLEKLTDPLTTEFFRQTSATRCRFGIASCGPFFYYW
jgi:hypothetical protein